MCVGQRQRHVAHQRTGPKKLDGSAAPEVVLSGRDPVPRQERVQRRRPEAQPHFFGPGRNQASSQPGQRSPGIETAVDVVSDEKRGDVVDRSEEKDRRGCYRTAAAAAVDQTTSQG